MVLNFGESRNRKKTFNCEQKAKNFRLCMCSKNKKKKCKKRLQKVRPFDI